MGFSPFNYEFFYACLVAGTFVLLAIATYGGILLAMPLLERYGCYAVPNVGSHHRKKIPHGAGLVIVAIMIISLLIAKLLNLFFPPWLNKIIHHKFANPESITLSLVFFATLFLLCLCSFTDDIKPKSVVYRLSLQVVAAAFVITLMPGEVLLGYAPYALDKLFALLFIVTFANFVNFIDGCDGMCGVQVLAVSIGLVATSIFTLNVAFNASVGFPALVLGATMVGFLILNWQPAKIFLGDAGSVPIGFFLAVLLLLTSSHGYWEVAVILPLYCYCDAGITLLKRMFKREKFWQPHKKHFFRQAIESGREPRHVVCATAFVNACLIILALYALRDDRIVYDLAVITLAGGIVLSLLLWMRATPKKAVKK